MNDGGSWFGVSDVYDRSAQDNMRLASTARLDKASWTAHASACLVESAY